MTLEQNLQYFYIIHLKEIANSLGIGNNSSRKDELVQCLAEYTLSHIADLVQMLTEEQKLFLAEMLYDGSIKPAAFQAKYDLHCPFPPAYNENKIFLLLVHPMDGYGAPVISLDLIEPLKALFPKPPVFEIATIQNLPENLSITDHYDPSRSAIIYSGEKTVFQEIRRVLFLIQSNKLQISEKEKKIPPATVKAVKSVLVTPDFSLDPPKKEGQRRVKLCGEVRPYVWPIILLQMGFCKSKKGDLIITEAGKEFIKSPTEENYRKGIISLLQNDDFDEMQHITPIRGLTGKAKEYIINPSARKKLIRRSMIEWPVNEWISFNDAFRFAFANKNEFWVVHKGCPIYLGAKSHGYLDGNNPDISKQYLRVFLFETLATLGLIDVVYTYPHRLWPEFSYSWGVDPLNFCSRCDGLLYVRLNPLGAYCLGAADRYDAPVITEEAKVLKVLPTHEIIFSENPALYPNLLHFLELIALRKGDYNWELDKKKILNYTETGGTITEIIDFLNNRSKEDFPKNLTTFFKDIESKLDIFGEKEEAILVEVKDAIAAAHIAHSPHTRKFCYLAGEHRLAIIAKNLKAFREGVKKLGYVMP